MLALLIPLEGFLLYRLLKLFFPTRPWREIVLFTFLILGAFIVITTEGLGVFHSLTALAVRSLWVGAVVISLIALVMLRIRSGRHLFRFSLTVAGPFEWTAFSVLLVYFLVTLFTALLAPPNTNDSLQYHMSRVMHWVVNQSVDFYATTSDRQLWIPPFAEYAVSHLYLLAGNDRFVNLVQWFSMAGSVLAVGLIAARLGAKRFGQWFAMVFTVTLPMGILQATSTQTDYVIAFWSLCAVYFVLVSWQAVLAGNRRSDILSSILLGLSFSLGILTKGTHYPVLFPFFLFYFCVLIWKRAWKHLTATLLIGMLCVLSLNLPFWLRNHSIFGSPLGPAVSVVGTSSFEPPLIFSTAIRNATNQLAAPVGPSNKLLYILTQGVHNLLGIDLSDPRTSLGEYRIRFSYHEDFAGNPAHFLFGGLSVLFVFYVAFVRAFSHRLRINEHSRSYVTEGHAEIGNSFTYAVVIGIGYLLFALLFKWQSSNSRLLLPWLVALGPLAGLISDWVRPRGMLAILVTAFFLGGLPYLLSNPSRPLLDFYDNQSMLAVSRTEVLFYNSPEIRNEYNSVVEAARDLECTSIGLEIESTTPEYLIWHLLFATGHKVEQVGNLTSIPEAARLMDPDYRPCAVFCSDCRAAQENGYELVYNRGSLQLYIDPDR